MMRTLRAAPAEDEADGSLQRPFDALVLGAGNVGLLTALLLKTQGLQVQVLDRRTPPAWAAPAGFDTRVYAISGSNRARLEALGVWQHLPSDRLGQIAAMEVHGDRAGLLNFTGTQGLLATVVEEGALQHALSCQLDSLPGRPWRALGDCTGVEITPGCARLQLAGQGALHARLLVGADGSRSWLRDALGWTAQVHDYDQQGLVLNLSCTLSHQDRARQWFSEGEVIALLPLGDHRVSLVWSAHTAAAQALLQGGAHACLAALQARIGTPLGALQPISQPAAFPLRLVRVPRICSARAVLVGDAAHGVHPLAGQGLNLGLEDAFGLADTLATRGAGPDPGDAALLRRHARRRAEPVALMQQVTDSLHHLFAPRHPWLAALRNQGLNLCDRAPLFKSLLAAAAAGTPPPARR